MRRYVDYSVGDPSTVQCPDTNRGALEVPRLDTLFEKTTPSCIEMIDNACRTRGEIVRLLLPYTHVIVPEPTYKKLAMHQICYIVMK